MRSLIKIQAAMLAFCMVSAPSVQAMRAKNTTETAEQTERPDTQALISDQVSNALDGFGILLVIDYVQADSVAMATVLKSLMFIWESGSISRGAISLETIWSRVDNQLDRLNFFEQIVGPGLTSAAVILNAKYQIDENIGWDIWNTYIGASARLLISGLFFMGAGTLLQNFASLEPYHPWGRRSIKAGLVFTVFATVPIAWNEWQKR